MTATLLENLREQLAMGITCPHTPRWRAEKVNDEFTWLFDGDRGVALISEKQETFELRCPGPHGNCPPAILPKHYHTPTQHGVRIIFPWRLRGKGCGDKVASEIVCESKTDTAVLRCAQRWTDGTQSATVILLRYDPEWTAYVAEVHSQLRARRITTALEFCNVLPAGIGDTRPGRERYPFTFWSHPDGWRKLGKNPIWFCSAGSQDILGEKRIGEGGCLGFGPGRDLNPVVEIVRTSTGCGAMTCDGLQDEHLMALPGCGREALATGWAQLEAHYRLFSIPQRLVEHIVAEARMMTPGPMLAWKFQYPAITELPDDINGIALPGSPFYGRSDWSTPVPWDKPFAGRLWTASPDPRADIHYDRAVGHEMPGSIRLRARGTPIRFAPASGHSLHTEAGKSYRFSIWIKAEGEAKGWIEAAETLFRCGDTGRIHRSPVVSAGTQWRQVATTFTACGDEAPFVETLLCAEGPGQVWFADMEFAPVS